MKKIATLLCCSLVALGVLAFDGTRLSITAPVNGHELKVEIDGRRFAMKDNAVIAGHLSEGRHEVKIFRELRRNGFGFGRREIIYQNTVFLRQGFHLDITLNRFGKALVDERRIDVGDDWYDTGDVYYEGGASSGGIAAMNAREFEQVRSALRKEWFESNRLTSARHILERNAVSTAQVMELLQLFTFESNRLELAKIAYRSTVDPGQYYRVLELFGFGSSRDELARYIRQGR
ncbi:MAG: hypothetical protein RJA57_1213 [Bacteroidota bacterium]|jgi:hypothetical protein